MYKSLGPSLLLADLMEYVPSKERRGSSSSEKNKFLIAPQLERRASVSQMVFVAGKGRRLRESLEQTGLSKLVSVSLARIPSLSLGIVVE